jgi:hypothetical protein
MPNKKISIAQPTKQALAFLSILTFIIILALFLRIPAVRAFGGAVWFNHGLHYMSEKQIETKIDEIIAPQVAIIAETIKATTQPCSNVSNGFCQKMPGEYANKVLVSSEVAHQAGTPDQQVITGYCTRCRDGSLSPSCAIGRGACSWHGGVDAYNVPQYRTILGRPEVSGSPAVYSYDIKSYKNSPNYVEPTQPPLSLIVGIK